MYTEENPINHHIDRRHVQDHFDSALAVDTVRFPQPKNPPAPEGLAGSVDDLADDVTLGGERLNGFSDVDGILGVAGLPINFRSESSLALTSSNSCLAMASAVFAFTSSTSNESSGPALAGDVGAVFPSTPWRPMVLFRLGFLTLLCELVRVISLISRSPLFDGLPSLASPSDARLVLLLSDSDSLCARSSWTVRSSLCFSQ